MIESPVSSPSVRPASFITVVSGLPRSGTSMMMKMLRAAGMSLLTDNLRGADMDNPNGYYEFERVKNLPHGDQDWLAQAAGKAVKIVAPILPYLPPGYEYRVLFMRRTLREIVSSQDKMLERRGEHPVLPDDELERLLEKQLLQVDAWMRNQADIHRLDVHYNRLLLDPDPVLPEICRFLGGTLEATAMRNVINPGLYRQRVDAAAEPVVQP